MMILSQICQTLPHPFFSRSIKIFDLEVESVSELVVELAVFAVELAVEPVVFGVGLVVADKDFVLHNMAVEVVEEDIHILDLGHKVAHIEVGHIEVDYIEVDHNFGKDFEVAYKLVAVGIDMDFEELEVA